MIFLESDKQYEMGISSFSQDYDSSLSFGRKVRVCIHPLRVSGSAQDGVRRTLRHRQDEQDRAFALPGQHGGGHRRHPPRVARHHSRRHPRHHPTPAKGTKSHMKPARLPDDGLGGQNKKTGNGTLTPLCDRHGELDITLLVLSTFLII